MTRMLVVAVLSLVTGAAGALLFVGTPASDAERPVRDVEIASERSTSIATRETLRARPIPEALPDVYEIPSPVSRRLATYQLAAVSNPSELQDLIYEADRIADPNERSATLAVLFEHLAETDPRSAAQLAATELFVPDRELHNRVWAIWATTDFEDALTNAALLGGETDRRNAARALYMTADSLDSPRAQRIKESLGIRPDRQIRIRYIEAMADRSLDDTVEFLRGLPNGQAKWEYAAWAAYHLATVNPAGYEQVLSMELDAFSKRHFMSAGNRIEAQADPRAAVAQALADPQSLQNGSLTTALAALAEIDQEAALAAAQGMAPGVRRGRSIATVLGRIGDDDPETAIAMAIDEDVITGGNAILSAVLQRLASRHPELVMSRAVASSDLDLRRQVTSSVMNRLATTEPQRAVALIATIGNRKIKSDAQRQLASSWFFTDPEGTLSWLESSSDPGASKLAAQLIPQLAVTDPARALAAADRFDDTTRLSVNAEVAGFIARQGDLEGALAITRKFPSREMADQIVSHIVSGLAIRDPDQAWLLLGSIQDSTLRDNSAQQMLSLLARKDPARTLSLSDQLQDENLRHGVQSNAVRSWYEVAPAEALDWVDRTEPGEARDQFIVSISNSIVAPETAEIAILNSIESDDRRLQTFSAVMSNTMRQAGIEQAERLIEAAELTPDQRDQLRSQLESLNNGARSQRIFRYRN